MNNHLRYYLIFTTSCTDDDQAVLYSQASLLSVVKTYIACVLIKQSMAACRLVDGIQEPVELMVSPLDFPIVSWQVPAASVKHRPWMDLGIDSAGALHLRNKLSRWSPVWDFQGCGDPKIRGVISVHILIPDSV